MREDNPVSPKVTTASVTAAITTLIMFVLDQIPWVRDMPTGVEGAILVLVTAGLTFFAGYQTTDPLRQPESRQSDLP